MSAVFALLAAASTVHASPVRGSLIKASGPAVYYYSQDGKRYVFPNEATYRTWFSDFSGVQVVTDNELAQIMIGGNATYRPGTRLIKITTDPKVYAVSGGGILRWVSTEAVARSLFGDQWASSVDDVPDPFFINYQIGSPITQTNEYTASTEQSQSSSIDIDRGRRAPVVPVTPPVVVVPPTTPVTPPVATTTTPGTTTSTDSGYVGAFALQYDRPVQSGSRYRIVARPNPSGGLQSITFQTASGTIASCDTDFCQPEITAPTVNATTTVVITGVFRWFGSHGVTSTLDVMIVPSPLSNQIFFANTTSTIRTGSSIDISARTGSEFSAHRTRIYQDGILIKECTDVVECLWRSDETSSPGTVRTYTAQAEDLNGLIIYSRPYVLTVTSNS